MNAGAPDALFIGSIPELYDRHLVPLIFEPYAPDLAVRVAALRPSRVLEIAAGTGVLTRRLSEVLPAATELVASDLNGPMIEHAAAVGTSHEVKWRVADAADLPFSAESFDVVVCQFGVMFFPDKPKAFSEARRVLRPGGVFLFSVWDRLEKNEFAETVTAELTRLFPAAPPRFLLRVPHGYHDPAVIASDVARGGFGRPLGLVTVPARSRAASALDPAIAYCQGTPLRNEIEAAATREIGLSEATAHAGHAIAARFGPGPVDGLIQAHVVAIEP